MHRRSSLLLIVSIALAAPVSLSLAQSSASLPAVGQTTAPEKHVLIPFKNAPVLTPGELELVKLESQFQDAVGKGGGAAFASWFADDGVTLNNGQPAVLGRQAIAGVANWDPKSYQLTWYVEGAQMGPSGDTGFTWGHYDAHVTSGVTPKTLSGRYITFWKKVHGTWKVALDASSNDAPTP